MLFEFTFNKKLLFLLIFPIFKQIQLIVSENYIKKDNHLFKIFRMFLSYEFSIIFLIISEYKKKTKKKENKIVNIEENVTDNVFFKVDSFIDADYKKLKKSKRIRSILFLILLSIINAGSYFFNFFVGDENIYFFIILLE